MKIGEKITSTDALEKEVTIDGLSDEHTFSHSVALLYIHVDEANTGTIQFSAGDPITAAFYGWPAGSKVPITVGNARDLRYKASATGQTFAITK